MNQSTLTPLLLVLLVGASCGTTSSESAGRDQLTANVGRYDPPPSGQQRVRVGVPPFKVEKGITAEVSQLAADQLTTLGGKTGRFAMIERAQLDQLLTEQGLEGIVKAGEMAKPAQVRGVDYLLYGKVTNLRIKAEKSGKSFGLGSIPVPGTHGALGLFDYKNKNSTIKVDCGVDLRLVDPTTGEIAASESSDYTKTDTISSFGIDILGANADASADLKIDQDNQGKILRLALDECVRNMLPEVDQALSARAKAAGGTTAAPAKPAASGEEPVAKKFCTGCGKELAPGAKFCPGCGAKTD